MRYQHPHPAAAMQPNRPAGPSRADAGGGPPHPASADASESQGDATAPAPDVPAWCSIDLGAVVRNARAVAARSGRPLLPMVKADAYGLGAVPIARALAPLAPWGFGIATLDEAATLREAGVAGRIVCFTPLLPAALPRARALGVTPAFHRADDVARWAALGGGAWHLAVDTGMARAGARWDALDDALIVAVAAHPPEGACTHFHSADDDDPAYARRAAAEQVARFEAALARLPQRPAVLHVENSPAVMRADGPSPWDVVRPGIWLYGVGPSHAPAPEPVAHVHARVVDLRRVPDADGVSYGQTWHARGARRIATVALGYADGYRRAFSNAGLALLRGREVPVAGRITMDMTMLDVTACPDVQVGDVATLLGREPGAPPDARTLTATEVAARGALSPYELLAGLRLRLPHRYVTSMPDRADATLGAAPAAARA